MLRITTAMVALTGLVLLGGVASAQSFRPPRPPPPVVVAPRPVPARAQLQLEDADSRALPTFQHFGRRYVLGELGERYRIHVTNPTAERVEAVISVDGLDAIDGGAASVGKRGYVIPAFGSVTVDGFRTSTETVAAFRFTSVRNSYAARKDRARNVGVIGVALFRELARPMPLEAPRAAAPSRSAEAKRDRGGLGTEFGESRESRVRETTFVRASSEPTDMIELRYDDRDGLVALGVLPPERFDDDLDMRETARPFPPRPGDRRFATPPP